MKICKPEVHKGKLTCRVCNIPFEGPFAISHDEMVALGSNLSKIHRPCGHPLVVQAMQNAALRAEPMRQSSPPAPKANYAGCIHRGDELRLEQCPTCNGHVQVKVFACAIHGECQLARKIQGVAVCDRSCGEFQLASSD